MNITMIAGSNRKDASSTHLLQYIGRLLQSQNISVTLVDLHELQLPLYSPDNEEVPSSVQCLRDAVTAADGLILATPEYHGSISGVLKNALDYIQGGQLSGKAVLSVSSSGGPIGVSSLTHLQSIVRNLHGMNSPEWISIGYGGYQSFDAERNLIDEGLKERVDSALQAFVALTQMLASKAVTV